MSSGKGSIGGGQGPGRGGEDVDRLLLCHVVDYLVEEGLQGAANLVCREKGIEVDERTGLALDSAAYRDGRGTKKEQNGGKQSSGRSSRVGRPGFLAGWWAVFWDVYRARGIRQGGCRVDEEPSASAERYVEFQKQHRAAKEDAGSEASARDDEISNASSGRKRVQEAKGLFTEAGGGGGQGQLLRENRKQDTPGAEKGAAGGPKDGLQFSMAKYTKMHQDALGRLNCHNHSSGDSQTPGPVGGDVAAVGGREKPMVLGEAQGRRQYGGRDSGEVNKRRRTTPSLRATALSKSNNSLLAAVDQQQKQRLEKQQEAVKRAVELPALFTEQDVSSYLNTGPFLPEKDINDLKIAHKNFAQNTSLLKGSDMVPQQNSTRSLPIPSTNKPPSVSERSATELSTSTHNITELLKSSDEANTALIAKGLTLNEINEQLEREQKRIDDFSTDERIFPA
eukprot:Nk52_evm2s278 gene=Nk52_evmTU2s278